MNNFDDDDTSVSRTSFRRLVARLADYYRVTSDTEFIARQGVPATGQSQLHVTFDDAYQEIVDKLLWANETHGFKATVCVIPDYKVFLDKLCPGSNASATSCRIPSVHGGVLAPALTRLLTRRADLIFKNGAHTCRPSLHWIKSDHC
ncbi:MAG: hypothetical protein WAQ05_07640 [Rubrivivax sp.]